MAALMTTEESSAEAAGMDGVSLLDDQPIDFSKVVASSIDGVPMVSDCYTHFMGNLLKHCASIECVHEI